MATRIADDTRSFVFRDKVRALLHRCELAEQRLRQLATATDPEGQAAGGEDDAATLQGVIDRLHPYLQQLRRDTAQQQAAIARLEEALAQFQRLGADAAAIDRAMDDLREQVRATQGQMQLMRRSFSWRVTAPVRAVARRLGGATTDSILEQTK